MIINQRFVPILDLIGSLALTADFQVAAAILAGTGNPADHLPGLKRLNVGGDGVTDLTYGSGDEDWINSMGPVSDALITGAVPNLRLQSFLGVWMQKLNDYLSRNGKAILVGLPPAAAFSNLDQYASYANGLTRFACLVSPNLALLQYLYNNSQGGLLMQPGNVFAPATHFGTGTVAAGAAVTYAGAGAVRTANDTVAGNQGYTPAPGAAVTITQAVTGTLTLTMTATGMDAGGNVVAGRTWTAVLDNAALGARIVLTPAALGDRIASTVSVVGAGTAGAGAFSLDSVLERTPITPPGGTVVAATSSGALRRVVFEKPTGTVNGVNTVFTAQLPVVGGIEVYLNMGPMDPVPASAGGLGQVTVNGSQVTFAAAPGITDPGDFVRLCYFTPM